jgi:hypothetical protein
VARSGVEKACVEAGRIRRGVIGSKPDSSKYRHSNILFLGALVNLKRCDWSSSPGFCSRDEN